MNKNLNYLFIFSTLLGAHLVYASSTSTKPSFTDLAKTHEKKAGETQFALRVVDHGRDWDKKVSHLHAQEIDLHIKAKEALHAAKNGSKKDQEDALHASDRAFLQSNIAKALGKQYSSGHPMPVKVEHRVADFKSNPNGPTTSVMMKFENSADRDKYHALNKSQINLSPTDVDKGIGQANDGTHYINIKHDSPLFQQEGQ